MRRITELITAISKRKNRDFKVEASLHGFTVPDLVNKSQDSDLPDLTPEQEKAMQTHLENAMQRKMMEKSRVSK
jgi:hypothetical protein